MNVKQQKTLLTERIVAFECGNVNAASCTCDFLCVFSLMFFLAATGQATCLPSRGQNKPLNWNYHFRSLAVCLSLTHAYFYWPAAVWHVILWLTSGSPGVLIYTESYLSCMATDGLCSSAFALGGEKLNLFRWCCKLIGVLFLECYDGGWWVVDKQEREVAWIHTDTCRHKYSPCPEPDKCLAEKKTSWLWSFLRPCWGWWRRLTA